MRYTKNNLQKLESVFRQLDYNIRYEKGNFQSGYCIVENQKIAVINKFFDTEARINCLLEILSLLEVDTEVLSDDCKNFYQKIYPTLKIQKQAT